MEDLSESSIVKAFFLLKFSFFPSSYRNSEKWSKNENSPYRSNKSRFSHLKGFASKPPMHIEFDNSSLNYASFNMNSPTKPFNLLNFDLFNRYNLDEEFSDSESPKSGIPQMNHIKKKSSPKIKIMIPDKTASQDNIAMQIRTKFEDSQKEIATKDDHFMIRSLDESPIQQKFLSPKNDGILNLKVIL